MLFLEFATQLFSKKICKVVGTILLYSETLNKEYIERIQQMSYSSLSDNEMLQIFRTL